MWCTYKTVKVVHIQDTYVHLDYWNIDYYENQSEIFRKVMEGKTKRILKIPLDVGPSDKLLGPQYVLNFYQDYFWHCTGERWYLQMDIGILWCRWMSLIDPPVLCLTSDTMNHTNHCQSVHITDFVTPSSFVLSLLLNLIFVCNPYVIFPHIFIWADKKSDTEESQIEPGTRFQKPTLGSKFTQMADSDISLLLQTSKSYNSTSSWTCHELNTYWNKLIMSVLLRCRSCGCYGFRHHQEVNCAELRSTGNC